MVTETVQAWQVDPGDTLVLGGDVFNVADVVDETEAITLFGYWEDESTQKSLDRHPYDVLEIVVSWEDSE